MMTLWIDMFDLIPWTHCPYLRPLSIPVLCFFLEFETLVDLDCLFQDGVGCGIVLEFFLFSLEKLEFVWLWSVVLWVWDLIFGAKGRI